MIDKPFKTYAELVEKLRTKGLSIPNEEKVVSLLKRHSYFSLICGYKSLFKQTDGTYKPSTTIEDVFALFEFDNELRKIFFHAILTVEKHIKSLLSYSFSNKYGDSQRCYLDPNNYAFLEKSKIETYKKCEEVRRLIQTFEAITKQPFSHSYVEHQWKQHKNIPLWVAVKAVTFGTVSKMYSLCTQDVQAAISIEFPGVTAHQLEGMLDFLTQIRNVCAHNERLYDYSNKKRAIPALPLHTKLKIPKKKTYYKRGQYDLFAAVICLRYLLSADEFKNFVEILDEQVTTLCSKTKQIHTSQILSRMGFPVNWKDCLNY